MILKCESCIESWIFPTFFDWLLFIPGPRPSKMIQFSTINKNWRKSNVFKEVHCIYISGYAPIPTGPPQASPSSSSSANQLQPGQRSDAQNQRTPSPARTAAAATQPQKSPSQPNAAPQQQQQKLTPDKPTSRHCKRGRQNSKILNIFINSRH